MGYGKIELAKITVWKSYNVGGLFTTIDDCTTATTAPQLARCKGSLRYCLLENSSIGEKS